MTCAPTNAIRVALVSFCLLIACAAREAPLDARARDGGQGERGPCTFESMGCHVIHREGVAAGFQGYAGCGPYDGVPHPCCPQYVHAMIGGACQNSTNLCYVFADDCIPEDWHWVPDPDGGLSPLPDARVDSRAEARADARHDARGACTFESMGCQLIHDVQVAAGFQSYASCGPYDGVPHPCCPGVIHGAIGGACQNSTDLCYVFAGDCIPEDWHWVPAPDGGLLSRPDAR